MSEAVRVLHVDDEVAFLDLSRTLLERQYDRLSVETATSAKSALEHLSPERFNCIISDYDMPGQDGLEFLESVRDRYPDLPFILFTGKGSEDLASEAISTGVTDYVQKKPGVDQYAILAKRVMNAVDQYRSHRAAESSRRRLRELAESSNDILWMVSGDWSEVLFINSAYGEVWGRSAEMLRADASDFLNGIHPDDRPAVRRAMNRLSNGEPVDIEYRVNEKEDFSRRVWVSGRPIFDDEGSVVRIAGFGRDITDRTPRRRLLSMPRS